MDVWMGKSCNKISGASATINLKEFVVDESFDKFLWLLSRHNALVIIILLHGRHTNEVEPLPKYVLHEQKHDIYNIINLFTMQHLLPAPEVCLVTFMTFGDVDRYTNKLFTTEN